MATVVTRICVCGKEFHPHIRDVQRSNGKFCSRVCSAKNMPRRPKNPALHTTIKCALCGQNFSRRISQLLKSKSGLRFCSRTCKDKAQRIESGLPQIHPSHYGTAEELDASTYRRIAFLHHQAKCNRCGYDRFRSVLRVHHKDRDRGNRDPYNLEVLCPTCHEEDHFLAGDGLYSSMKLVECAGFAPAASCLQDRRSPK